MTVPASVHFSDSGTPLDPAVRSILEGSFAVDLSGIRLHVGPRTDAFLRARGCPAATSGCRVFMPARRRGGSERWLHVLAHEVVHAIQQAQGIARAGGFWEWHAEAGAMAVTSGGACPDLGLQPPRRGHGAAVLVGFNSWEHRLIGDVPGADLVRIATEAAGWQDVVAQQIQLVRLWQDGGPEVTGQSVRAIMPGIGLVTLPGSGCLATYGEVNAVADYAANAEAVNALPARYMFAFLQQIRQESLTCLCGLLGIKPQNPDFAGAVTPYLSESGYGVARETGLIDTFTLPLGVNHYRGLLARNACHFAPFAWQRWRHAQAHGSIVREQAYHQYLRFLEATVVQLSSKKIHDHFNEHGLDMTSSGHPGVFRIYGDGKLLSGGADVSIVAGTVAASRAVISDIIANGQNRTPPWEIIDMLPDKVVGSVGRPVSLPDWHEDDLKNQAPDLFSDARSMFLGIRSPSVGIVSADQETAEL